ncbi:MAG: DUF927 domain-containing protein [Oscillospiraceae bacterium]|nr:DUF927 domain-containing protein [Oscillospiraceae bacterium]
MKIPNANSVNHVPMKIGVPPFGTAGIPPTMYKALKNQGKSLTVGSGKNQYEYCIVHIEECFIAIYKDHVLWIADSFTVEGIYEDTNGNHSMEILHNDKCFRINLEELSPKTIASTLLTKGISLNPQDKIPDAFAMYLQLIAKDYEVQDAKQIMGWRKKDNKLIWDDSSLEMKKAFASDDEYIQGASELMKDNAPLQFVVAVAVASILLAYLRITVNIPVNSFGLSLAGLSSTGKTTAQIFAASMFGSPDKDTILSSFYGTQNALIYALGRHFGTFIAFDEATVDNKISMTDFLYIFSMGKSKKCLDTKRQLRETDEWLCTACFSSECSLIDLEKDNEGIIARIITLEGYTYSKDSEDSNTIKTFSRNNHGIVAKLVSELLLDADPSDVKQLYEKKKDSLSKNKNLLSCSLRDRLIENHAMILTTADILTEIGFSMDVAALEDISVTSMNKIAECSDRGGILIQRIFSYLTSHPGMKGVIWEADENKEPLTVLIEQNAFETVLKDIKYPDSKKALNLIDKKGCLVRQSKGRYSIRSTRDGVPYIGYRIDVAKVKEIFGDIAFETSSIKEHKYWDSKIDNWISSVDDREAIINGYNCKNVDRRHSFEGKILLL